MTQIACLMGADDPEMLAWWRRLLTPTASAAPLHWQMRDAAETLAAQIEAGEFDDLAVERRCELRQLPMAIASWADRVETMAQERAPARKRRGWLARLLRRLGGC